MATDITLLLGQASAGDRDAADRLLPIVYEALRTIARQKMSREKPGQTLQATALVHEAYLRLVRDEKSRWENRRHFFAAAAEAMRRILIERARRKARIRHGGEFERIPFEEAGIPAADPDVRVLALDEALSRLEETEPRKAEVVKLRYFIGMTIHETAETLGVSPATVKLDWTYARAWLHREIAETEESDQAFEAES